MSKLSILLLAVLISSSASYAQTNTFPTTGAAGIGTTSPNSSSLLDVTSTTKGVLIPRMTKTQRDAITSPAQGLLIYQSNSTPGFYYYDGGAWAAVTPKAGANKNLSNLNTTSINLSLLPLSDNSLDLGSSALGWKNIYADGALFLDNIPFLSNTGDNVFAGQNAGLNITSGTVNTAVGNLAMYNTNTGSKNTAIGYKALYSNTNGYNNVAMGPFALYHNTNANFNHAIGYEALYQNTTGYSNIALGFQSMNQNNSGNSNIGIGYQALFNNTSGSKNIAIGDAALIANVSDSELVAIGDSALANNTTGKHNLAIGYRALKNNTSENFNIAIGANALATSTTGWFNVAIGASDLYENNGSNDIAIGFEALRYNRLGTYNIAIGTYTLLNNHNGYGNTAVGHSAAGWNTNGNYNTCIGNSAGLQDTIGSENTMIGYEAGPVNMASGNTFVGYQAGYYSATGTANTVVGRGSFHAITANHCTVLGYGAGNDFLPGSNCTLLGYETELSADNFTNSTAIGYQAIVSASNTFVFGNSSVVGWGFGVAPGSRAIKVGTSSSNGNGAYLTVGGVWTNAVSMRSKKEDITQMDKQDVLKKINQLEVTKWKIKGTENEYHIGPMVDQFYPFFRVGDDTTIADIDKTGVLFLGVQALTEENERLKAQNEELQNDIAQMKNRMDQFDQSLSQCCSQSSMMSYGATQLQTSDSRLQIPLLGQNIPNPFDNSTLIPFRIPKDCNDASIMITNTSTSEVISVIPISCNEDHVSIDAGVLASGTYSYTLYVDGKMADTKNMVLQK